MVIHGPFKMPPPSLHLIGGDTNVSNLVVTGGQICRPLSDSMTSAIVRLDLVTHFQTR
jgi:hypothetical protein